MFGFNRPQGVAFLVLLALIIFCPLTLYPVFLMNVLCFALLASAFNLLIGYVGLMSFGHAAYFGMGAYVSAFTAKEWGFTPELAVLAGGLTGELLGVVFGWVAIRRQGIYFAMITLALAQMNYFFCLQAPFTHGEDGIQQVPRGKLFGLISLQPDMSMYIFIAVLFLFFFLLIHRIVHSPFGQVLKAIRENEPRATSLGYRTDDYKLIAFIISCFIAGIAGGAKAVGVWDCDADGCELRDLWRDRVDDAGGWHGDDLRPGGWRAGAEGGRELPGRHRQLGYGGAGLHLRGLRAGVPARRDRRVGSAVEIEPVRGAV